LGCRLYFCDRTYEEERNALHEKYLKAVREIETRHSIDYLYAPVTQIAFLPLPSGGEGWGEGAA